MKEKELNYYDEFIKNIGIALEMTLLLKEYIENYDYSKIEELEQKVHTLENEADQNLHNILNYLIKDFLPPIEREDIVGLANKIDDLVDNIDEIVIDLNILYVKNLREDFIGYIYSIYNTCVNLKELMEKFKNSKKRDEVRNKIIEINKSEEIGDKLFEKSIKDLYKIEQNPIEISKWYKIYECLENCFDLSEVIANCVEEIIMKNG